MIELTFLKKLMLIMMSMNLSDIATLNNKWFDYSCIIRLISKNDRDLMQNADMTKKSGTLKNQE